MDVATHLNNKSHGQDRVFFNEHVYAVMDGVSRNNGDYAAEYLQAQLADANSLETAIESIHKANTHFLEKTILENNDRGFMTTIVGYADNTVFSAGDSVAYAITNSKWKLINPIDSYPHAPNMVTQVVGLLKKIHQIPVETFDYLLLMSDGFSDNLFPDDLAKHCSGTAAETRDALVELLAEYSRQDMGEVYGRFKDDDQALIVLRND